MLHTELSFERQNKKYKFKVAHNLDELGLNIDLCLFNWANETDIFTEDNFCKYVRTREKDFVICIPEKQHQKIISTKL